MLLTDINNTQSEDCDVFFEKLLSNQRSQKLVS